MKKILLSVSALTVLAISCNNQEKKEEQPSVEQAVEQMTQALDTTNAVAAVVDSTTHAK